MQGSSAHTAVGWVPIRNHRESESSSRRVVLRPEQLVLVADRGVGPDPQGVPGTVESIRYHGHDSLTSVHGHVAIGHTRYSTTGSSVWENAQPTFRPTATGNLALGHNGNLTNTADLSERLAKLASTSGELPINAGLHATTDTEVISGLLAAHPDLPLEQAALEELPKLLGAFSLVFMDDDALYAARDAQGIRPLVLGRLERGWVIASETAALDIVGASVVREVEPGELVVIDSNGLRSHHFAQADPKGCLFEYVYLARPDTTIAGRSVQATRVEIGRQLAREYPVEADLVIPVPESGRYAA
ncbi:MAG: hypothetical protein EBZ15_08220, partial [Actinobacteria bacterium]|nr:hypothetical protein [Actinomycetota bacterium]